MDNQENQPSPYRTDKKVVIIGAGISGLYMASLLSDHGYLVSVLEKRPDPRLQGSELANTRSINFTLSFRGLSALDLIGVRQEAISRSAQVIRRAVHLKGGGICHQSYSCPPGSGMYSITRNALGSILLDTVERRGVCVRFGVSDLVIDRDAPSVCFRAGNEQSELRPDFIIGADGAFSRTRAAIQKGILADYHQEYFDWVYKEFTLTREQARQAGLENESVHTWARNPVLLLGLPNFDGSVTCNLIVSRFGKLSAESLATPDALQYLIHTQFPELSMHAQEISSALAGRSWGGIMSMRTRPWSYGDKVVLVGDACHAVVHFYAQGMNASLEDCATLARVLEVSGTDRAAAFRRYENIRCKNTDALAELSKENFFVLSASSASTFYEAKSRIDSWLAMRLPGRWRTLYGMIAHSNIPYADAREIVAKQSQIWRYSGIWIVQGLLGYTIAINRLANRLYLELRPVAAHSQACARDV